MTSQEFHSLPVGSIIETVAEIDIEQPYYKHLLDSKTFPIGTQFMTGIDPRSNRLLPVLLIHENQVVPARGTFNMYWIDAHDLRHFKVAHINN